VKTPQQAAQNWANSAGRAAQAYTDGVNNYSGDWAGATVAQESTLLTNVQQAITSGRWRQGVQATGTGGWKSATQAKAPNYSQGFSAGAQKQAAAIAKIISAEQGIVGALPARGTHDQNVQRSVAFQNAMHALKGQLGA
jgi:hypothetical protein